MNTYKTTTTKNNMVTFKPMFCFQEKGSIAKTASGFKISALKEMTVSDKPYQSSQNKKDSSRELIINKDKVMLRIVNRHGRYLIVGELINIEPATRIINSSN